MAGDVAKRVLVVEDNELNLKLFCDLLRAHDYVTEGVRDGRDAVARAREFMPDMIVMDIQLPHVTGFELITQIKADDGLKAIPIMAVTAYAGREDEDRIRAAGADAYVSKPISLSRFVDTVSTLMEGAAGAPVVEIVEEETPVEEKETATDPGENEEES
jgi:two-component system cell cycle response regulator DivK